MRRNATVTQGNWSVATQSSSSYRGVYLQVFRRLYEPGNRAIERGTLYPLGRDGKHFADSETANAYALDHGYTQVYRARPAAFICPRLSPATRRFIAALPTITARWDALARILGPEAQSDYFRALRHADYMSPTRHRFDYYMATGIDPENYYHAQRAAA
jgi:hypothetical protein